MHVHYVDPHLSQALLLARTPLHGPNLLLEHCHLFAELRHFGSAAVFRAGSLFGVLGAVGKSPLPQRPHHHSQPIGAGGRGVRQAHRLAQITVEFPLPRRTCRKAWPPTGSPRTLAANRQRL